MLSWCTKSPLANCIKKTSKAAGSLQKEFAFLINFSSFLAALLPSVMMTILSVKQVPSISKVLNKLFHVIEDCKAINNA